MAKAIFLEFAFLMPSKSAFSVPEAKNFEVIDNSEELHGHE
jgi:hypothetical protein